MKTQIQWFIPVILCLLVCLPLSFAEDKAVQSGKNPWEFFVFDNGVGRGDWSAEKQARLVKAAGYAGISYNYTNPEALAHWQRACRDEGLKIYGIYAHSFVDGTERYQPELREAIRVLKGSDTVIWMTLRSSTGKREGFDEQAVRNVREVAGWAAESGLRVVLYPHAGFYAGTAEECLRIHQKAQCDNVGLSINLCHEMMGGNEGRIDEVIAKTAPYVWLVSINGAEKGKRTILRLGEGDYDVEAFLLKLRAAGYRGAIGQQCYSVKGDQEENLKLSMEAWKPMKEKLLLKGTAQ